MKMKKVKVTHKCGHVQEHELCATKSIFTRQKAWHEMEECDECKPRRIASAKKLTANVIFARDLSQFDCLVFFVRKDNETIEEACRRAMKEQNVFSGKEEFVQGRRFDGKGNEIVCFPEYNVREDGIFIAEVKISETLF